MLSTYFQSLMTSMKDLPVVKRDHVSFDALKLGVWTYLQRTVSWSQYV